MARELFKKYCEDHILRGQSWGKRKTKFLYSQGEKCLKKACISCMLQSCISCMLQSCISCMLQHASVNRTPHCSVDDRSTAYSPQRKQSAHTHTHTHTAVALQALDTDSPQIPVTGRLVILVAQKSVFNDHRMLIQC